MKPVEGKGGTVRQIGYEEEEERQSCRVESSRVESSRVESSTSSQFWLGRPLARKTKRKKCGLGKAPISGSCGANESDE